MFTLVKIPCLYFASFTSTIDLSLVDTSGYTPDIRAGEQSDRVTTVLEAWLENLSRPLAHSHPSPSRHPPASPVISQRQWKSASGLDGYALKMGTKVFSLFKIRCFQRETYIFQWWLSISTFSSKRLEAKFKERNKLIIRKKSWPDFFSLSLSEADRVTIIITFFVFVSQVFIKGSNLWL